jgi:hypothetical protein
VDVFTVAVGFSTVRPIIPDQHFSVVIVAAETDIEARRTAAQMVATHSEMPTSTEILSVTI